jgi:hypothetical protein
MDESVVEPLDVLREHARPAWITRAQNPKFFLLADMRQVPYQRAHQRVELAIQLGIVEISESMRSLSRSFHIASQCFSDIHDSALT